MGGYRDEAKQRDTLGPGAGAGATLSAAFEARRHGQACPVVTRRNITFEGRSVRSTVEEVGRVRGALAVIEDITSGISAHHLSVVDKRKPQIFE